MKFNDSELDKAYLLLRQRISDRAETLDKISADIKALERELERSVVRDELMIEAFASEGVSERLAWRIWPDGGKRWRILYERATERRPFIETPGRIRLRLYPQLVELIKAAASLECV